MTNYNSGTQLKHSHVQTFHGGIASWSYVRTIIRPKKS